MDEKRKAPRVKVNIIVTFKISGSRLTGGAHSKDISESGVCIPSKQYFAVDTVLDLEMRADDLNETLKTSARVVRANNISNNKFPFELGLVFLDLPSTDQRLLNEYISRIKGHDGSQNISWIN